MRSIVIVLFLLSLATESQAEPAKSAKNARKFISAGWSQQASGNFVDIPDGSIVEGSTVAKGMQPNYEIDFSSVEFKSAIKYARKIKSSKMSYWKKIEKIQKYVSGRVFIDYDYEDPRYVRLAKHFKNATDVVPLSRYAVAMSGVCREFGLVTHLLLKEAGIENFYGYAEIQRASKTLDFDVTEDHAFNLVYHDDEYWVVDSYYWGFNGFRLLDLLSEQGITKESVSALIAKPAPEFRRIVKMHDFPIVWTKKNIGISVKALNVNVVNSELNIEIKNHCESLFLKKGD